MVKGDSTVFLKGYGVRALGKPDPVTPNTLFAIGSNTKSFTAAAIGMLVDDGKMRWDDKVTRWLPGFQLYDPYVTRELTLRDVLSHRAGLGRRGDYLWLVAGYPRSEVLRRIRFLEPMTVSTLSGHRRVPPYGMAGGEPGSLGANRIERADGSMTEMAGCDSVDVGPGDVLVVETPGGGGYGRP